MSPNKKVVRPGNFLWCRCENNRCLTMVTSTTKLDMRLLRLTTPIVECLWEFEEDSFDIDWIGEDFFPLEEEET